MPRIPVSRLGRTARLGGLVAGQGVRYLTHRSPERRADWAAGAATQLVEVLGTMKGAAQKLGQVLSTIDLELVPEGERDAFKAKLAELRADAPPLDFAQVRPVLEAELGSLDEHFARFGEVPVAAASIGQVHRATTHDGRDVAVKVQYPGIAEAVDTDLRNAAVLVPILRRMAPGVDAKALLDEVRDRIGDELDYEVEAQHHRRVSRAFRGHPLLAVPDVDTRLSTRRVLVTAFLEGEGFETVKARDEATRDRVAEVLFRFFYGAVSRERLVLGDPHPGNVLLLPDGRVGFLDFGLARHVPGDHLDAERALARAVVAGEAAEVHARMAALGYLPDPGAFDPEAVLAQLRLAGEWYFTPGFKRLDPDGVRRLIEAGSSPRSPHFAQMRRQTIPPQALLLRRMEALLLGVLGELRAGADWGALALEYIAGTPPSTPLGEREAAWLGRPTAGAAVA